MKHCMTLGCYLAVLSAGHAEPPKVVHTLSWVEVYAGTTTPVTNPDGVIGPGEGALLTVSIAFTPAVGTVIEFEHPVQGSAPVLGLMNTYFNLVPEDFSIQPHGTWNHFATAPHFTLEGIPAMFPGSLYFITPHQPPGPGLWYPSPANPIENLFSVVWTPDIYVHSTAIFEMVRIGGPHGTHLYVDRGFHPTTGNTLRGWANATPIWDSAVIPIVPAPGALVAFAAAIGGAACNRRRRN